MLRTALHALAAQPLVYEVAAAVLGGRISDRRLAVHVDRVIEAIGATPVVLDIGAGTGRLRKLWPRSSRYIALDVDSQKFARYQRRSISDLPVIADRTRLPVRTSSVDAILCVAVSHHVPDAGVKVLLEEARRVLKPNGSLLYFDAVWEPTRRLRAAALEI